MRFRSRLFRILAFLATFLAVQDVPSARAQTEPVEISFPNSGEVLTGGATIVGTAAPGDFQRYEVSFGFDPNPTDTWFPIGQPGTGAVTNAALVEWNTTIIGDGIYMLRLQVFTLDTPAPLEVIIRGVVVQNSTATPSPTPEPATHTPQPSLTSPVVLPPTATVPAAVTLAAEQTEAPLAPTESTSQQAAENEALSIGSYGSAFCRGAGVTFVLFFLLWVYARIRAVLRPRIRHWLRRIISDLRRP